MSAPVNVRDIAYDPNTASHRTLSKSDFKLARTCAAKLFFRENQYPANDPIDGYLKLLQRGSFMVEALAKARYPDGVQLDYGRDVRGDSARTMDALRAPNVVLFEATLLVGRRLARVDILEKRGDTLRLIEVKSSTFDGASHASEIAAGKPGTFRTSKKPYDVREEWRDYFEEIAFQTSLLEALFPDARIEPWLVLLDASKQALVDDIPSLFELVVDGDRVATARYVGTREQYAQLDLVTEIDVREEVALVRADAEATAVALETKLDAPLDEFTRGLPRTSKCGSCEFRHESAIDRDGFAACWGELAKPRPHVLELFSVGRVKSADGRPVVEELFDAGKASLFDIPLDCLTTAKGDIGPLAKRQRRQIEYTKRNEIFVDDALYTALDALRGPLHFVDFEAARLALPYHAKMRAYGLLAFQWSCHTATNAGDDLRHTEWLNEATTWPNQSFAESLRTAIGDDGPVLTWSSFEAVTLRQIAREVGVIARPAPELVGWLTDVAERRVVDLHKWCVDWYYHPGMRGRTSIKVVLDALWRTDPSLRAQFERWTGRTSDASADPYASLPQLEINGVSRNVHEGTGAVLAYEEMMYGASRRDPLRRDRWASLLKQYCHLDTLSMVLVFEHWRRRQVSQQSPLIRE